MKKLLELVLYFLCVLRPVCHADFQALDLAVYHLQPPVRPSYNAVLTTKLLKARQADAQLLRYILGGKLPKAIKHFRELRQLRT